ncbi:MAG TPA: efflux RND transporter permease subunit [Aliidongia sp.]|nr:efflux RND transporter permease subunit [Aliidongia sp.]
MFRFFIDRPIATALLAGGLLIFGTIAFMLLPVAALPDIDYPNISVSADLPGASAEVMAATVAAPLEHQLSDTRGIISMTSVSTNGATNINMLFEPGRNMDGAGLEVQTALQKAAPELPADLPTPPTWQQDNPSDYSILGIALTSKSVPLTTIDAAAETLIVRRASLIPGVRRTFDWSRQAPAVKVQVNPMALAARGLSLEDIRLAIASASVEKAKGSLDAGKFGASVDANDQLFKAIDFNKVIVSWQNGAPVRLGDVATVVDGPENEDTAGWFNGEHTISFGYRRVASANIIAAINEIKQKLPEIKAQLPAGVDINIALDRSVSIKAAIDEVELTLLFTILLVVVVIFAFLRSVSATIIPAIAIPVALLSSAIVMRALGYSLDNLSLMALTISVGFVVDDAIVVIENIVRHVEEGMPARQAAYEGVRQVGFTIISITLSLIAVFIPVLLMGGVIGRLFREFGVTISAAILISAAVSLFITPMMCARFLKAAKPQNKNGRTGAGFVNVLVDLYARSLDWALIHRGIVLLLFLATVGVTGWLYVTVPKGFFPPQDIGRVDGTLIIRPDLSLRGGNAIVRGVDAALRADPDVRTVLFFGSNFAIMQLVPPERRHGSLEQIVERLRKSTNAVPGATFYLQPERELVVAGGFGGHGEFQYTLTDASRDELNKWEPKLLKEMTQIPGLRDVAADDVLTGTNIKLNIDRDLAARMRINVDSVDQTLFDAFGRRRVSEVFTDALQYYVTLQASDDFRMDERSLDNLYVKNMDGGLVPLSAFTQAKLVPTPLTIKHKGGLPVIGISFNLDPGVSLGEAVDRIHAVEQRLGKPATLLSAFEGTAGEFERSLASQPYLIGAALLVVYIVLGMLYESLLHPLTILSTLPSAGIGALLALSATGHDLSIIALIGILLLIGIVKKNGIMLVDFAIQAERDNGSTPVAAIREACIIRFRPIMMTTFAALVGALPLALGWGAGSEIRRPLGIAIVGGLVLSQILTLYTTPVVYLTIGNFGRFVERLWQGRPALRRPGVPGAVGRR